MTAASRPHYSTASHTTKPEHVFYMGHKHHTHIQSGGIIMLQKLPTIQRENLASIIFGEF